MYRLVIIEDDYFIRTGLASHIPWDTIGFEVVGTFEDGQNALESLAANPVDVVLSDIRMPIMSGLELARELHQRQPGIYIAFLSAYEDFRYAQQAIEYGVRKYIVKSSKYDDLVEIFGTIKAELDSATTPATARGAAQPQSHALPAAIQIAGTGDRRIDRLLAFIREHCREVTLRRAADELRMSPVYLSRFFKEKTGVLFIDFVSDVRMQKAAELIRHSDHKLYEVSEMVGYSNPKNFSRAFRHHFGVSPQEYRNA
jgi:two-component system, response regulator YesN